MDITVMIAHYTCSSADISHVTMHKIQFVDNSIIA